MYKKEILKQEINLRKEYRIGMDLICDFALSCKGTVYGGYVRDKIIEEYYTRQYFNNSTDKSTLENNYWEPECDKDTVKRMLLPKDIDIHFIYESDFNTFMNKIKNKFDITTTYLESTVRIKKIPVELKKIRVMYEVGKKLSEEGDCIFFELDIKITDKLEAPFNSLDFYTNSLLLQKNKNNYNVSKSTGINMNCDGHFNYVVMNEIIGMVYKGETRLVSVPNSELNTRKLFTKIVDVVCNDWKILNFDKIVKITECENSEEKCVICLEDCPHLRILNCSYTHENCLKKHIKSTTIYKEGGGFYFMGPQREKINI